MTMTLQPHVMEPVDEPARAELLLHPLRQRILTEARQASTAAEIARRLKLPAQKVNYHVRTLVEAGFLIPAGEGRKRNLVEKRYRASARSYLLTPKVLGSVSPDDVEAPTEADRNADRFSATHLMGLTALLQTELSVWLDSVDAEVERVPTLSLDAEVGFASAEDRAAFAEALGDAIGEVIRKHTTPARAEGGSGRGHPYRLVLGCYPIPGKDRGS
jgi:DNA-binding transcriptional ArsR family regulator